MDRIHVIRHKVLVEGVPKREVARQLHVGRNTVDRYVAGAEPGKREAVARPTPVRDAVASRVDEILEDSRRWTQAKQKLTARRLWRMLVDDEHFDVGYTLVKELVAEWKRRRREVFVPLIYRPGEIAEVDFFEVIVDVNGARVKAWMFVMRLMFSKRDFCWLYPRQDATCFLDGHVRAFAFFGGVPERIIYDNLKAAVARILVGGERALSTRFLAMSTHYVFEPNFARPATGHDKGGVEARGKGVRWQHLVPIPSGKSLFEIADSLLGRVDKNRDVARFDEEKQFLRPLPTLPYRAAKTTTHGVTRMSLVKLDGAVYSVPCIHAGLDVTVHAGVFDVEIVCPDGEKIVHRRQPFGGRSVLYRHYLRELRNKPQAVRQVADVLVNELGEPFVELWRDLIDEHGEKEGARRLAKVIGAVDDHGVDVVAARLRQPNERGRLLSLAKPAARSTIPVPAALAHHVVEKSDVAAYDALLAAGVLQ